MSTGTLHPMTTRGINRICALVAASALLAACGGSAGTSATPQSATTPAGGVTSSSPTPTPTPTPTPSLPAHPTGAQVAAALGCGAVKAKAIPKNSGTSIPDPVSEVNCTLDGQLYTVAVYKTENDLTNALAAVAVLLPSMLRKPFVYGASDVWIVSRDTGKNGPMTPITSEMEAAVVAAGGVVKTVKPS